MLLLAALWPSKKKAAPNRDNSPREGVRPEDARPLPPERPEASKQEPSSIPTRPDDGEDEPDKDDGVTARVREELEEEAEERRKKKAAKKAAEAKKKDGDADEAKKPKGGKKPPTPGELQKREREAAKLAASMHQVYLTRGFEGPQAAADALSVYLLAGGDDPGRIKEYQHLLGVPETGGYDTATREAVIEKCDIAVDRAISHILTVVHAGEDPSTAAAEALAVYVREQQANAATIVLIPEKLSALQMQFTTPSGKYDQNTKNELVKLGVVPP